MTHQEWRQLVSEAADVVQEYRDGIVETSTLEGLDGKPDMATLEDDLKEEVAYYDDLIARMRSAE